MVTGTRIDYEKLKGAIGYGQTSQIAEKLNIRQTSLSRKLAATLSLEDLNEICFYMGRNADDFLETYPLTQEEMEAKRRKRLELKKKRKLV